MKGTRALLLLAVTLCQGATISRKDCSTDSQYKLLPHENCNQYYQCVNGALVVRDCPLSLYFNPEIESCDWKTNVDCGKDEDNADVDSPVGRCSTGQAEGQFLVHENCNQYYWCVYGNLIELTCNQGLLFNHETLRCDWAQNVDCKAVTLFPDTETPDYTENPITETEYPDIDVTPSPDNCYDSCGDKSDSNEDDSAENESKNESDSDESVGDEEDSSKEASDEQDSNENASDEVTSTEEASDEKEIDVNASDEEDSEEDNSNQDDTKEDDSSEEDSGDHDNNEDDSYEADVNKVCAVEGSDGVLIAHEDCSKFYKCSGGKPVVKNCPSDLLFNPDTEQCDWPKNVECGKNGKLYLKKKLEVTVDVLVRGKKYA